MTTRAELMAAAGQTLTAKVYALNSDAVVAEADSVTEQSNSKGAYVVEFSETLLGAHLLIAYAAGVAVSAAYCLFDGSTAVRRTGNYADVVAAYAVEVLSKIARNKTVTDPVSGTFTVYDDDGATPLLSAPLFENVAETQPYRGRGAEVRGRLE